MSLKEEENEEDSSQTDGIERDAIRNVGTRIGLGIVKMWKPESNQTRTWHNGVLPFLPRQMYIQWGVSTVPDHSPQKSVRKPRGARIILLIYLSNWSRDPGLLHTVPFFSSQLGFRVARRGDIIIVMKIFPIRRASVTQQRFTVAISPVQTKTT